MALALTVQTDDTIQLLTADGNSVLAVPVPGSTLAGQTLAPQPLALQGNLFVDPQNVTGAATPSGSANATVTVLGLGPITARVFSSYQALAQQWGTYSPILTVPNTQVIFVSPHTDLTDPVIFTPESRSGANAAVISNPVLVSAGVVLAGTVAKNTAVGTNSPLITNLGATALRGHLVVNTTAGKASRAYAYKAGAGTLFTMTNPVVPQTVPYTTFAPTEVNTWANGDTVNLYAPLAVNLVRVGLSNYDQSSATFNNAVYIYQVSVPNMAGSTVLALGDLAYCLETVFFRTTSVTVDTFAGFFSGCAILASHEVPNAGTFGGPYYFACAMGDLVSFAAVAFASPFPIVDLDTIIGAQSFQSYNAATVLGSVCLDGTGAGSVALVGRAICEDFFSTSVIYGTGVNSFNVQGSAGHFVQSTGRTFVAVFTAPGLVAGTQINGITTAQSHTGASPDVINSTISVTPAHLDAAAGVAGFGGTAFRLGGAAVSNIN